MFTSSYLDFEIFSAPNPKGEPRENCNSEHDISNFSILSRSKYNTLQYCCRIKNEERKVHVKFINLDALTIL